MSKLNDQEKILSVILENDGRYARDAYIFILGVIDVVLSELEEQGDGKLGIIVCRFKNFFKI